MKRFFLLLIITFAIALIPTIFIDFNTSYLIKPALFPSNTVFPIVWSILYILMTISLYITSTDDNVIYKSYFIQLIVNALWSPLFFGLKWYLIAFIWLVLLFILVIRMMLEMKQKSNVAFYLQIPYVIWILFAGYLNLGVFLLN